MQPQLGMRCHHLLTEPRGSRRTKVARRSGDEGVSHPVVASFSISPPRPRLVSFVCPCQPVILFHPLVHLQIYAHHQITPEVGRLVRYLCVSIKEKKKKKKPLLVPGKETLQGHLLRGTKNIIPLALGPLHIELLLPP